MSMGDLCNRTVLIAGGGVLGSRAASVAKVSGARVIIVDRDRDCLARGVCDHDAVSADDFEKMEMGMASFYHGDAVDFILESVESGAFDIVVPCIPGHLAGRVVERFLIMEGRVLNSDSRLLERIRSRIPRDLVLAWDDEEGVLITSYMNAQGRCRIPCPQPVDHCPETGRRKEAPMSRMLVSIAGLLADKVVVLRSELIGRGAGCLKGADLRGALLDIRLLEGRYSLVVATSCACHGILNAFKVE